MGVPSRRQRSAMKFGVSFWIWDGPFRMREHMWFLPRAKALGADVIEIEFEDDTKVEPQVLRSALGGEGLELCAGFTCGPGPAFFDADNGARQRCADYLKGRLDFLADAGGRTLITLVGGLGESQRVPPEEHPSLYARAADSFREVAEHAAEAGMHIAIEIINRYESNMLTKTPQALDFIDQLDSPVVGVLLDTFHMNIEEPNPAEAIRRAGARLIHLHCAENDRGIPGRGTVPWTDISAALHEIQYRGPAVIEVMNYATPIGDAVKIWQPREASPDDGAHAGLAFLKSTFSEC